MAPVIKWQITDGVTTVALAYNPTTMASPFRPKQISVSTALDLVTMNPAPAQQWNFTGNVYTQAEYDKLKLWHEKDAILNLTDHLGRTWRVVSESLDMTDRRNSAKNSTRFTYTWTVLNLGQVV